LDELDLGSVFDSEMIEDDVIPALEMAMSVIIIYKGFIEENPGSKPPCSKIHPKQISN
jgi:hypothetical protein